MCEYTEQTDGKEFTGYKSVIEVKGRFYSPCTLIEYKPGRVDSDNVIRKPLLYRDVLSEGSHWFNPLHIGRTAVFVNPDSARSELNSNKSALIYNTDTIRNVAGVLSCEPSDIKLSIVEMTIGPTPELPKMYIGESGWRNTVSGSNILKVEKVC